MKLRLNKLMAGLVMAGGALALVGCGGGGAPDLVTTAANDVTVKVTPASIAAIADTTFTFPDGVEEFGTTAATTFAVGGTTASPTFSIASDGKTALGALAFGSCILTVVESSLPSPLAKDETLTIEPCNFNVNSKGAIAGSPTSRTITLTLGRSTSNGVQKLITIDRETGEITINGVVVGKVTVVVSTGSGPNS